MSLDHEISELRRRLNSLIVKLKYKIVDPESLYAIIIPDIIEKLDCKLYRKRVGRWGVTLVFDCLNTCVHVVIKTTPIYTHLDKIEDMYYIIEETRCKESLRVESWRMTDVMIDV